MTASEDRTIKLWDISRSTYRQSTTFQHASVCQSLDVNSTTSNSSSVDCVSIPLVSGHADGGICVWDPRTGKHSLQIIDAHKGGVTSIFLDPTTQANTRLVTHGRLDQTWNVWDLRKVSSVLSTKSTAASAVLQTWKDDLATIEGTMIPPSIVTATAMSPDGQYVAAVMSNSTTTTATMTTRTTLTPNQEYLVLWRLEDGQRILTESNPEGKNRDVGLNGIAWGGGGGGGIGNDVFSSQLVTVDRHGKLTLWA
jgi:WD40 repeat protein